MISNFKQLLILYFISFANFWTNGSNKVVAVKCYEEINQLDALAKRVDELRSELKILRENEAKPRSPSNNKEDKCANHRSPRNCHEINECQNNLYLISSSSIKGGTFPVSCDFETGQVAWTVVQRRRDGSVNFNRNWTEYVHGFGDENGEFFIGLEKLHALTTDGAEQQLYIKLQDFEGVERHAIYKKFRVRSALMGYQLTVGNYSGDAGDSLSYHNGEEFYTKDHDNEHNCATDNRGGWWFKHCFESNLNGKYMMGKTDDDDDYGVVWKTFRGSKYSLKFTQMMLSPSKN